MYTTNSSLYLNVNSEQRNVKRFGIDQWFSKWAESPPSGRFWAARGRLGG